MFNLQVEPLTDGITKYRIFSATQRLRFDEIIALWQGDHDFRRFFFEILSATPYRAYRFETPAISRQNCSRKFEFVLIDSPWLDVEQDQEPFAGHFKKTGANVSVIDFDNLGGDAALIVPCPLGGETAYANIAAFMRHAPESQQHHLWQKVGQCLMDKISTRTVWLNTAGGGVDWLHIRLDTRPKYYAYQPYKVS